MLFNGLCYGARISFSWYHFDFGPTFLHVPTREAPSCMLLATNTSVECNTVQLMYNSTPQLYVPQTTWIMEGGDQEVLLLNFMPHEYVKYKEEISFQINGLDVVNVYVHGEGTPLVVELVDQTQKLLTFGPIHMGKVAVIHVSFLTIHQQYFFNWAKTMVWYMLFTGEFPTSRLLKHANNFLVTVSVMFLEFQLTSQSDLQ